MGNKAAMHWKLEAITEGGKRETMQKRPNGHGRQEINSWEVMQAKQAKQSAMGRCAYIAYGATLGWQGSYLWGAMQQWEIIMGSCAWEGTQKKPSKRGKQGICAWEMMQAKQKSTQTWKICKHGTGNQKGLAHNANSKPLQLRKTHNSTQHKTAAALQYPIESDIE